MLDYRVPHLRFDQLSPLSDSDYSQHLIRDAFPVYLHFRNSLMHVLSLKYSTWILSVVLNGDTCFFGLMRVFREFRY